MGAASSNKTSEYDQQINGNNSTLSMMFGLSEDQAIPLIVHSVIALVVCTGNGGVLFIIYKRKLLGRTTNIFIFSITMGDFILGCVTIPCNLLLLTTDTGPIAASYLCKIFYYTLFITKTVTAYTLLLMACEKLAHVIFKVRGAITAGRCLFASSVIWFFACSYSIWTVVFYSVDESKVIRNGTTIKLHILDQECLVSVKFRYLFDKFVFMDFGVTFFIPATVTLCVLLAYCCKNCRHKNKQEHPTTATLVLMLITLFCNFVVCQFPMEMFIMFSYLLGHRNRQLFQCLVALTASRGMWSLISYCYFKQYVCKKRRQHQGKVARTNGDGSSGFLSVPHGGRRTSGEDVSSDFTSSCYQSSTPPMLDDQEMSVVLQVGKEEKPIRSSNLLVPQI